MSESTCPAPAENPSGSPYAQGAPPRTRSGPAWSRSPRGRAGSSGLRAMVTASRVAWTHARVALYGSVNGAVARAMPLVHSSPSGRAVARTKNPPTIASPVPVAAHHASRGVGRAHRTPRTSVRADSYLATWSVVHAPSSRRRRSERRCGGDAWSRGAGSERSARRAAFDTLRGRVVDAPGGGVTAPLPSCDAVVIGAGRGV